MASDTTSLNSRLALVTGGMGGLGASICERLAADGMRVVATYSPSNDHTARWLTLHQREGFGIRGYCIDVCDYQSCAAGVERIVADLGPVDVLINNAGISRDVTLRKMTLEDWQAVVHTNLDSVFNMTKQVIDGMIDRGWGRIVNISSVSAQGGAFGETNYAAAKAGVHGFTKSLALEVAKHGVTVNTVSPGYLNTPIVTKVPAEILQSRILPEIPVGRLGDPDEVAILVAYLASQRSSFVTGANMAINGGQHLY